MVKAEERRWGPLGLNPTEPRRDEHGSALMCSVPQAGVADVCPVGSVLPLPLWGKLSPSPPAETSKLLGKGLQGKRENCAKYDSLGAHTGSRSCEMCGVGKACSCAGLGTASQCSCLPARTIYGLKGQKRQGLPWLWESSSQEIET